MKNLRILSPMLFITVFFFCSKKKKIELNFTNLTPNSVTLEWETNISTENFILYRSYSPDPQNTGIEIAILPPSDRMYTDTTISSEKKYYYIISTGDITSNEISFLTPSSEEFVVMVDPRIEITKEGREVYIGVRVENVNNLFGIAFELSFPSEIMEIDTTYYNLGDLLGNDIIGLIVYEENRVNCGLSKKRGDSPVNGSGNIIEFKFKALSQGKGDINLINVKLTDENGNEITGYYVKKGKIEIR